MAWDSRDLARFNLKINRMVGAFPKKSAAIRLEVPNQIEPLHERNRWTTR